MLHSMRLNPEPFEKIRNGTKTIELRLNDEKRRKVKKGDFIEFSCTENTSEKILTEVTDMHFFRDFEELYNNLLLAECGYAKDGQENASPADMEKFYTKEQQKKYGVVGIRLKIAD
ncbi:MAG: ASCH domain-containing protein [Ruminococcus sp.]|nr:ASCH domain-containing protein [Ruminococcus sp.]